jgi:hypothetical protein
LHLREESLGRHGIPSAGGCERARRLKIVEEGLGACGQRAERAAGMGRNAKLLGEEAARRQEEAVGRRIDVEEIFQEVDDGVISEILRNEVVVLKNWNRHVQPFLSGRLGEFKVGGRP